MMVIRRRTGLTKNATALVVVVLSPQLAVAASQHNTATSDGKPLAVAGGSTADGALVVRQAGGLPWTVDTASGDALAYNGNGGTNQQWQFLPA